MKGKHNSPNRTLAEIGEFGLIGMLRDWLSSGDPRIVLGIGDDAAALEVSGERLLLATSDIQIEETHFRRRYATMEQIGWKAMAISLSDIAAMGGAPTYALVSLGLCPQLTEDEFGKLFAGLQRAASVHGAKIVGGNLAFSGNRILVDVTLLGEVERDKILRRAGAHPGDRIYVSGFPGQSAAGYAVLNRLDRERQTPFSELIRAHLEPQPRLALGRLLAERRLASACIDISDGLSQDLSRLCEASGVGAEISADRLPLSPELQALAGQLRLDPLQLALHGGEDYELLFAVRQEVPPEKLKALQRETGTPLTEIGRILPAEEGLWLQRSGKRARLEPRGWDHFRSQSEKQ